MNVLIVEDEPSLREALSDLLAGAGHAVESTGDGREAVELGTRSDFDLLVLDRMLPGLDGVEVCRRIRRARPDIAVLMLTAKGAEDDKVTGLLAGADDYVTKPFGARELLARVEALGRRHARSVAKVEMIDVDGCQFDFDRFQFERNGDVQTLTPREVGILRYLHRNHARAVSRGELLTHIWGVPADVQTRTVDMTISNLRQKIESDPTAPRIVLTVKGVGYAWGGDSP